MADKLDKLYQALEKLTNSMSPLAGGLDNVSNNFRPTYLIKTQKNTKSYRSLY